MTAPAEPTRTGLLATAELTPGQRLADRYRIEAQVGIGGMGVVYRAFDEALGIVVALKLLRPELAGRPEAFERFRQELLLARQVSSPQVVRIHDIAREGGHWFISMDYVDGEPLDRLLDRRGRLPVDEALAITAQLAQGLRAAHAVGVVHRDLKPSNVLVGGDGAARISDFGVARSVGSSGLTQSGAIVGTPEYLSPEQARGGPVDARSDLYALGLMLHEMLAGEPAFGGGTPAETLSRRLIGPPPPVTRHRRDVPAWVQRLLARLLQPNPAHRFRDAGAVLDALAQRRVARDWRLGLRRLGWGIAAAAVGLAAWWLARAPMAPAPAPPPRLVVIAEPSGDAPDPALAAVAELIRQDLATRAGQVVADGERTELALAQVRLDRRGDVADAALLAALPAREVLRIARGGDGTGLRLAFMPSAGDGAAPAPLELAGPDLARAGEQLSGQLVARFGPPSAPPGAWPRDPAWLEAYGGALALQRTGRLDDAATAFAALATNEPGTAAAWRGLLESARGAGQRGAALDAARAGAATASPLAPGLALWEAALSGRLDQALARQREWLARRPADPQAHLDLAELQLEGGDFDAAAQTLRRALALDEQDPRAWFLLGKASILRGEPRLAVEDHLLRALVLFKRAGHLRGEAETTNALGVGYARLGQVEDAAEQYRKALELRRRLGDRRGTASSLRNLAQIATFQGRLDEAGARLDEARPLFVALGDDAGVAAIDNELGVLAEERGDHAAALEAYRRGLRNRERAGDVPGQAESLNNIGFAHYQLGDYDNARALWQQARDAFAGLDDFNGIVRVDQNLGLLATARGDWEQAGRTLRASLAEAESRHMVEEAAVSLRNLAELAWLQGRLDEAARHVGRAEALFEERGDQRGRMDAALLWARLRAADGDHAGAAAALAELEASLAEASGEQAAIAALIAASLHAAAGEEARRREALDRATVAAERAGVRVLALQARILAPGPLDAGARHALDREVLQLGNLPLHLLWLERTAADALDEGRADVAAMRYEEARDLLAGGRDYIGAGRLHALGASAYTQLDRPAEAAAARTRAEAAHAYAAAHRLAAGAPSGG